MKSKSLPMNIAILGGSNSVMSPGYVSAFLHILRNIHGITTDYKNLSIGANSSLHGLMVLKREEISKFNVFLIEYIINDCLIFRSENDIKKYRFIMEGIIQHIKIHAPNAKIFFVAFGRRSEKFFSIAEQMLRILEELSLQYDCYVIPIDKYLKDNTKHEEFDNLYSDDAHYRRHTATTYVGNIVAHYVLAGFNHLTIPGNTAFSPNSIASCRFVDPHEYLAGSTVDFNNSLFSRVAVQISNGESIEFTTRSELILVEFISTHDSGTLIIEEEGHNSTAIDTRVNSQSITKHKFLIRSHASIDKDFCRFGQCKSRTVRVSSKPSFSITADAAGSLCGPIYISGFLMGKSSA